MASERDLQDVINTLIAEGVGEGEEGMRRIAETILNRAEQRGMTPAEVVRQRAQYTGYSAPGPAAVRAQRDPQALTAAQAAWQMAQGPDDPTNGANHYWNPNIVNPSWAGSMTSLGQYGNHAFATDRAVAPRPIAPTPASQSNDMRLMRSPAMNPLLSSSRVAPIPASVDERVTARNRAPMMASSAFGDDPRTHASGQVLASIPTGVGPSTRTVQTTRVGNSANTIAAQRNEQARTRQATPVGLPKLSVAQMYQGIYPSVPGDYRIGGNTPNVVARAPNSGISANRVNAIGVPLSNQVSPVNGLRVTTPAPTRVGNIAPTPLTRLGVFGGAQPTIAARPQAPIMAAARAPVPMVRPPMAQPVANMPLMAQRAPVQAPLNILVQGSNTIQPSPMSAVQTLQAQGLSNAEAYARLTGGANPDAASRINGKSGLSSSGGSYTKGYEF